MRLAGAQATGIEHYYRVADVFMILSEFDIFGMVVLEAMAAGLPVLISGNVGAKDLIVDGKMVFGFEFTRRENGDELNRVNVNRYEPMGDAAQECALVHGWNEHGSKVLNNVFQNVRPYACGKCQMLIAA